MKLQANSKAELVRMIRGGDRVTARFRSGPDVKERTGTANALLLFPDHVVIDLGGRHGLPGYVDANNIVSVSRRKA